MPRSNAIPPEFPMDRRAVASPLVTVGTLNAQFLMDNCKDTNGKWVSSFELVSHALTVAKMLEQLDSDVIVVNEVGSFGALELARAFMGQKGRDYRVYTLPTRAEGDIEPAILTKIDIVHPLMTLKRKEHVYLRCTVARLEVWLDAAGSEKQSVELYGTHLVSNKASPSLSSMSRREKEAELICDAVNQALAYEPQTVFVIAGDMNEEDPVVSRLPAAHNSHVFTSLRVFGNLASCYDSLTDVPATHDDRVLDYVFAPASAIQGIARYEDLMGTLVIPRAAFSGKPGDHSGVSVRLLVPHTADSLYAIALEKSTAASNSRSVDAFIERETHTEEAVDKLADSVSNLVFKSPVTRLERELDQGMDPNATEFVPGRIAASSEVVTETSHNETWRVVGNRSYGKSGGFSKQQAYSQPYSSDGLYQGNFQSHYVHPNRTSTHHFGSPYMPFEQQMYQQPYMSMASQRSLHAAGYRGSAEIRTATHQHGRPALQVDGRTSAQRFKESKEFNEK